ncbi:MAG: hypothetical protein ABID04_00430 [Patescibacteria group bacterium]
MTNKTMLVVFVSGLVCFLINYFLGNSLLFGLANAVLFSAYAYWYCRTIGLKRSWQLLPLLALMPVFTFAYEYPFIYLIEGLIFLTMVWSAEAKSNLLRWALIFVLLGLLVYGFLLTSKVLSGPLSWDRERLIYPQHLFGLEIARQQRDSLYLPYRARFLAFNDLTSYGYFYFGHLFNFLSLETAYRSLLLVNVFYFLLGLINFKKLKGNLWLPVLMVLLVPCLLTGLVKTPDTLSSVIIGRGAYLGLILFGIEVSKKRWPYLLLWLVSCLLILVPR